MWGIKGMYKGQKRRVNYHGKTIYYANKDDALRASRRIKIRKGVSKIRLFKV